MNEQDITGTIEKAVASLFEHQPNIVEFTAQTKQTEWNLAYHLAVELGALFPALNCDIEVLKRGYGYGNRRPDVVFHTRGTHKSNFLVIEIKRNGKPADVKRDINKIRGHWFRKPLRYQFGASINLRLDGKHEIQVLKNTAR